MDQICDWSAHVLLGWICRWTSPCWSTWRRTASRRWRCSWTPSDRRVSTTWHRCSTRRRASRRCLDPVSVLQASHTSIRLPFKLQGLDTRTRKPGNLSRKCRSKSGNPVRCWLLHWLGSVLDIWCSGWMTRKGSLVFCRAFQHMCPCFGFANWCNFSWRLSPLLFSILQKQHMWVWRKVLETQLEKCRSVDQRPMLWSF